MAPRFFVLTLALAGSLLAGCSKNSAADSAAPKTVNLGTVELTYGTPARQDLGDKAVCVFTAQPLSAGQMELVAAIEKGGKQVAVSRMAPTGVDQPIHLVLANYQIDMTPHVK